MLTLAKRYATPLTTGLFLVSLVSGVALFFHWGASWFHGMHEWLSMLLIAPFALHLWRNWRPMAGYLKRPPLWIALGVSAALAAVFVVPVATGTAQGGGRPPQFAFAERLMDASVAEMAAAFDVSPAALQAHLAAAGWQAQPEQSLASVAAEAGVSSGAVMAALLAVE